MSAYFHKLAAGYDLPPLHGVHCFVRTFPWTEEFTLDGKRIHYYEEDDLMDAASNEAFLQSRIKVWTALFDELTAVKSN